LEELSARLQREEASSAGALAALQLQWRTLRSRHKQLMEQAANSPSHAASPIASTAPEQRKAEASALFQQQQHGNGRGPMLVEGDGGVSPMRLTRVMAEVERSLQRLEDAVPRAAKYSTSSSNLRAILFM
jgi:hypothetical protein